MKQEMKFCQSCGMPLTNEVLGTNADGSKSEDYCIYCYKDGKFTNNCTMDEMIEFCAQFVDEVNKGLPSPITKEEYIGQMKMYFPHLKRWRKELTIADDATENPALAGIKDLIAKMADTLPITYISSVDEEGFPCTKAMLSPRKREGIKVFYFTTNTFSLRVAHFKANPKACVYFCDAEGFKGMMLRGTMEVLTDAQSKEMIWHEGDEQYYPGGVTDPNYCVLKFTATDGRFYSDFFPRSFVLSEPIVYLTKDISSKGLVNIYKALGIPVKGRVAIKMSTGEGSNPNYLKPELIKDLVFEVDGTIVECNTAYGNGPGDEKDDRNNSANHWKVIERHGFTPTFKVDIMDEEGEIRIPVQDSTHLKYDIVGDHMANYDFMIALNHFKGHPMGGYGGALKNLSIGCASANGKAYIHSSGKMEVLDMEKLWTEEYIGDQDGFLESMAAAAQAVVDYFQKKDGIVYISVMNNMSIDCDCVDHPAPVKLEDYGILASTDPVALDQACVDIINNQQVTATNDPTDLLNRIDKQHGVHTIEHAEAIGLGSRKYTIVNIDK